MSADPLGRRRDDDVGAVVDGSRDIAGSAESVIDDQRDAGIVSDPGQGLEVGDVEAGVANGFDIDGLGLAVDGASEIFRIVAIDELDVDSQPRQGDLELVVGAAVEVAGGDDVVAGLGNRGQRQKLRRLPGTRGDRRHAAFEGREALFEDVGGRIHDAGVDIAELLQREQAGAMLGIVEGV
jgi:hypothetical protein